MNATDAPDGSAGPGIGTGVLLQQLQTSIPAHSTVTLPSSSTSYYVGNAASLLVILASGADVSYSYQFNFTLDAAGLFSVADFAYSKAKHLPTIDQIPIMGPFLSILCGNNSAAPLNTSLTVFTSPYAITGVGGLQGNVTAAGRILVTAQFQAIPANTQVNFQAACFIPGLATLAMQNSAAGRAFIFTIAGNNNNSYVQGFGGALNGAQYSEVRTVTLPNDDWQLAVINDGAAGSTAYATVTSAR